MLAFKTFLNILNVLIYLYLMKAGFITSTQTATSACLVELHKYVLASVASMMFASLLCASVIQRGSSRAHEYESSNYYPSSRRQTYNSGISEIVRMYFPG